MIIAPIGKKRADLVSIALQLLCGELGAIGARRIPINKDGGGLSRSRARSRALESLGYWRGQLRPRSSLTDDIAARG